MGIFTRRPRTDPVHTSDSQTAPPVPVKEGHHHTTHTHNTSTSHRRSRRQPQVLSMSRRPPFGQWLKHTLLDILTMAAMGAIGLGVYEAHPAPSRSFPINFQDGTIVYPQFAYPLRKEIIPIWAAALLAALVPIVIFLICQIRVRSFWDVNNAVLGLLYSLINAAVFQVFLKWLIGGLRPHFLTVCAPDITRFANGPTGNGFESIMYDRTVCTGDQDEIDDSLESFPSGHSTAAFAGFVFLYLYLNAKLKVWSNYHPAFWKLIATYAPILAATLIAGALTIDEYHNWYDCLAGAIIGTVMAVSAYRMVYASVWDFRFNHIPLNRGVPFSFGIGGGSIEGGNAVFTRKAGWGDDEGGMGGAPFDAASGIGSGIGSGFGGHHSAGVTGNGHEMGHMSGQHHTHNNGIAGTGHDGYANHEAGVVDNGVGTHSQSHGGGISGVLSSLGHSHGHGHGHDRNVSVTSYTGRNSIGRKEVGSGGHRVHGDAMV